MYIYNHRSAPPTNVLSGMGADRYIPPKNVDPVTGEPQISPRYPVPWAVVEVGLRGIDCRFYQDAPRELVLSQSMPYTLEITAGGHRFIGSCRPNMRCPTSVHQNAQPRDPWRIRQCNAWAEGRQEAAAQVIEDPEFRANITERVLDVAGIDATFGVQQAEFLEVVTEREARERSIKVMAALGLIGSAGVLTFLWVRKWAKNRKAKQQVSTGDREES